MAEPRKLQTGEIVDIAIKGARIVGTGRVDGLLEFESPKGFPGLVSISNPIVVIERNAPAEWPPQVRDLWEDGAGDLWFAFEDYDQENDSFVNLRCSVAKPTHGWGPNIAYYVNDEHGPMTLIRREQQGGGESHG